MEPMTDPSPAHNPSCRVAVDGLIDGKNSQGEVDEPGACAEKDVREGEENGGASKGAVKHG